MLWWIFGGNIAIALAEVNFQRATLKTDLYEITGDHMRKALTLLFYLAMVGGGFWAVYEWLVLGGRGIVFKAGGFIALFGAYLIWMDFLSPNRERL